MIESTKCTLECKVYDRVYKVYVRVYKAYARVKCV